MNQLDAADRARTLSDLEAREEHVARKERILSDAQLQLESLMAQVAAKQGLLESINSKVEQAKDKLQSIANRQARALAIFKSDETDLVRSIDKLLGDKTNIVDIASSKRKELRELNATIAVRKQYLDAQELMIDNFATIGNSRLSELRGEVSLAEGQQTNLLRDIVRHEQMRDDTAQQVGVETDKLEQLKQTYQQRASEYRTSLKQLASDLETQRQQHEEAGIRFTAREQALKAREQAVTIKGDELDQELLKLNQRIRKFESDKAIS